MSKKSTSPKICPHLGLTNDPGSHFSYSEAAHRCFATKSPEDISLEHQNEYCLYQTYRSCSRFVEPDTIATTTSSPLDQPKETKAATGQNGIPRLVMWAGLGLIGGLMIVAMIYLGLISNQGTPAVEEEASIVLKPTATIRQSTPTTTSIETATPAPTKVTFLATATPTSTPLPDTEIYTLSPTGADMGWVTSSEEKGNHFGDSFLYAGNFDGQIYLSGFQFSLQQIPRGAPIHSASIELVGLNNERLAENIDEIRPQSSWLLRMLDTEIDQNWRRSTYQDIFNARVVQTLNPILTERDLGVGKRNVFELSREQINFLEARIIEREDPTVAFRLEGPIIGPNSLFAWDTGYGPQSNGNKIILRLDVGSPPATPPAYDYVIVTSTPTPENVVTAAAITLDMTAEATRVGTATPVPPNMVTATPFPDYLVVVPTPTPENQATAQAVSMQATAAALTTGTPTPLPTNAVTATPTATETPTPIPTAVRYVIITSTPTPESIFAAATLAIKATAVSNKFGTPTPLPANWVTPAVVTVTPTPLNQATTQAFVEMATAVALTTGTPTPIPSNMVTATPTPVFNIIPLLLPPTPPPPPGPTPEALPPALVGKILFVSDREGSETDHVYAYDPQTGELGRLTNKWPYEMALERDTWSADERFRVFTKNTIRYKEVGSGDTAKGVKEEIPAIYAYDYFYNVEKQLTNFGAGIAYGGVWSPTSNQIAFLSNDSGDDEIWVIDYDTTEAKQLTASNEEFNAREIGKDTFIPELSKYPTWSPDGTQIVFVSNRTGNNQLWIMNADGSDQKLLMGWDNWTPYNDNFPVWVKYLDAPPPLPTSN